MAARLSFIFGTLFFILNCKTASKIEIAHGDDLGFHTAHTDTVDINYINLGFVCEPERDESYKKRTDKLIDQKTYVIFYDSFNKIISQSWIIFNSKTILYSILDEATFKRTASIEIELRNKTISVMRDRFDSPITLPNSICN